MGSLQKFDESCIQERKDKITRSVEDKRSYRALLLKNALKVLLISDPTTDKSAAALDVNVGHLMDPRQLPGLAHFCEHMLFLGTKKYPVENDYQNYLNQNGGSSNAYTSTDHTNYFFDVAPESLPGAIDRFAQFFRSPLFTASATEREVNAVDSENRKNLQSDAWRLTQLERSFARADHDFSKFGTGNRTTLLDEPQQRGISPRDELLKFHHSYYSSNMMSLCVLGKESLDELTKMVVPLFVDVEDKSCKVPTWPDHPYGTDQLGYRLDVEPVKDLRDMHITFPFPDMHPYYKANPGHYISHLLGHEGAGSLLSELKRRGWVNSLVAGPKTAARGFGFFSVDVELTEDGLENVENIVMLLFQYIKMMKNIGPKEWIHRECEKISNMSFRFKNLPVAMDKKEQWYGTPYHQQRLDEEFLRRCEEVPLDERLHFPNENEFIPTNFNLVQGKAEPLPSLLTHEPAMKVWHKQDDEFLLPKCYVLVHLRSPTAYADPRHAALAQMFVEVVRDSLTEYAYNAELAGLHYRIENGRYGLSLSISGYNEKQTVLLQKIVTRMTTLKIDPKRFDLLKESYIRSLKSFEMEQPYQHAVYYVNLIMSEQAWSNDEILHEAKELTVPQLQTFIGEFFAALNVEVLVHGNALPNDAIELAKLVQSIISKSYATRPLFHSQLQKNREKFFNVEVFNLDESFVFKSENKIHDNSAVDVLLQTGVEDTRQNMLVELAVQVLSEPCFDQLRTKEQLGYIVFSGVRRSNGTQGIHFIVQSSRTPDYVEQRVEAFIEQMMGEIKNMSEEEFQKHKSALETKRLEKPKKLSALAKKYWSEISSEQYNFDRDKVETAYLKGITKEDLVKFYESEILAKAQNRRKLSVFVYSTSAAKSKADNSSTEQAAGKKAIEITDLNVFKSSLPLWPLAKPYMEVPPSGITYFKNIK
ncbi:unnamed protein product [Soboliphyme baturini]|uniref:Insulin-degrading enzyme n=1 Tax=Soboliphyme baturini TaxID=241478 RepID=A0A183IC04_9BILA|nr:unnamed protein product [Soboliphyme baturini]